MLPHARRAVAFAEQSSFRRPGSPARYCRPEDIQLGEFIAGQRGGRIVETLFLGASQRLFIDIGMDKPIQVERSAREQWMTGQKVGVMVSDNVVMNF
ncbi:TOBE domain-containing protein [Pantoea sp. BAV 3049]|uniref:TOBE domain-containing protein n=1 Tax=Pantoea sp. BAV 3049 TaxID=2654188 RepID=UPI00131D6A23